MQRWIVIITIFCLFPSCMLTSKMDRIVASHYAGKASLRIPEDLRFVSVSTDSLPRVNGYCQSRYKRFFTVPLLIYTYSREEIGCRINPVIYAARVARELDRLMAQQPERFSGKRVHLSLTEVPSSFSHRFVNHYVFMDILFNNFAISITRNELRSSSGSLKLRYRLIEPGSNASVSGQSHLPVPGLYREKLDNFRRRRFVEIFIETFDTELNNACQTAAQTIFEQL